MLQKLVKNTSLKKLLSKQGMDEVNLWIAKYPADQKQSAVMAALRVAQNENNGWLSNEIMDAVADYLDMSSISVYEVATFYTMFELEPLGKFKICVCTNISCMLCGSDKIVAHLEKKLGIKLGATTPDGKYTLREVECLAACGGAPMLQIGNTYYENLTPDKLDSILTDLDANSLESNSLKEKNVDNKAC